MRELLLRQRFPSLPCQLDCKMRLPGGWSVSKLHACWAGNLLGLAVRAGVWSTCYLPIAATARGLGGLFATCTPSSRSPPFRCDILLPVGLKLSLFQLSLALFGAGFASGFSQSP